MGRPKGSTNKSVSQEADVSGTVEARPQHEGKDPLAEGNTLVNPTNTSAETHYQVKERSEDVQKASKIDGQNADERAEAHNAAAVSEAHDTPNASSPEQDDDLEGL